MSLPFTDITTFIYSFYAVIAISILLVTSVNLGLTSFKKGVENV